MVLFLPGYLRIMSLFIIENRTLPNRTVTPPGDLTAHGKFRLVLLCSQPDTVRRFPLRKTEFHHYRQSDNARLYKCSFFSYFCQGVTQFRSPSFFSSFFLFLLLFLPYCVCADWRKNLLRWHCILPQGYRGKRSPDG